MSKSRRDFFRKAFTGAGLLTGATALASSPRGLEASAVAPVRRPAPVNAFRKKSRLLLLMLPPAACENCVLASGRAARAQDGCHRLYAMRAAFQRSSRAQRNHSRHAESKCGRGILSGRSFDLSNKWEEMNRSK